MRAVTCNIFTILLGRFDAVYPLRHVLIEAAISAAAGAVLAVAFGAIYRLFQKRP